MRTPNRRYSADIDPSILGIPVPDLDLHESQETSVHLTERRFSSQPSLLTHERTLLPTLDIVGPIPRISPKTLCECLRGVYDSLDHDLYIIDCRFNYEFDGGHIQGASNINDPDTLKEIFFDNGIKPDCMIVFHCEFSQNRGPSIAHLFREIDRYINRASHPALYYPFVYILEGGYSVFYQQYPEMCEGGYQPMNDDRFIENGTCSRAMTEFRKAYDKGLKSIRRPLIHSTNSQRLFNSPTVYQTRTPSSPITSRYISKLQAQLEL